MSNPKPYEPQTPQRVAVIRETLPYQVTYLNHEGKDTILAAFQHERAYLDFLGLCHQASYADILHHLVEGARQSAIGIELGELESDVLAEGGQLPYDELLAALKEAIAEVEMLKTHEHEYVVPDDGGMTYCRICTRSGDI